MQVWVQTYTYKLRTNLHVQVCIEMQTLGEGPTLEETFNFRKSLEGVCVLRRRVPSVNAV